MPTTAEKRRVFRALHERGCFVIPNPWDIGTARYLQHLGFPAIATTSSGAAWSLGVPDTAVGRDAMLAHVTAIVMASDLPVNADFESGYAASPRRESARASRSPQSSRRLRPSRSICWSAVRSG